LNIISLGVGEISESDLQLAAASKATVIGFHTSIEAHAEPMVKELGVSVRLHDIIYHAQDDVKALMKAQLDKIPEEKEKGKAEVRALFKSSQLGIIAGCQVIDGIVTRNCMIRVIRAGNVLWSGPIASLKRFKDDVKEASKGTECGILLQGFSTVEVGDTLEAYEIIYLEQEL
jgi:translation initiation factor IF-2